MIVILTKLSGLYFLHLNRHTAKWIWVLTCARILLLCLGLLFVFLRGVYITFNELIESTRKWDMEDTILYAMVLRSLISMIFFLHWQYRGSLAVIEEQILRPSEYYSAKAKRQIRRDTCVIICISVFTALLLTTNLASVIILGRIHGVYGHDSTFDFIVQIARNSLAIYGYVADNLCTAFFAIVVRILSIHIRLYNEKFEEILDNHVTRPSNALISIISDHRKMAKKVFLTNEIFKMYLFAMASISAPQTVMAVLVMSRRKTWLGFYYSAVETAVSLIHLAQLTIIPAQVHSEFRIPQFLLYRNTSLWEKYSHDTYEIVRTFIRNISTSHFGISLGDFVVVTQSMMFKCISIMVPYIALCIQMKFGDDLTLRYNISTGAG